MAATSDSYTPESSHPTLYWHTLADGRVQCDLCPRACKLKPDQRGMCFVRANEGGAVVLKTYGRSSGFCIDPIEKKPLNHFLPGTPVLSFGTAGCNLACRFCQNWDISKSREMDTLADSATPEAIARAAVQYGCRSVAYTYNDPVIFMEYAVDVAQACREQGIYSVAVSAGYISPEPRAEFFQYMDAANIDLKGFNADFYRKLCAGELDVVLETLIYLKQSTRVHVEITNLIIPGANDSEKELRAMCEWILTELGPDVPLHFTAFHPDFKMTDIASTPPGTLRRARNIALESGIQHCYTGNVHSFADQSTYCHACKELLIGRDWYQLSEYHLDEQGRCANCETVCPGVFESAPGRQGPHRVPVRLQAAF